MNGALENPLISPLSKLSDKIPDANILVWLLVFLVIIYTLIHAIVFVYHWHKYNIAPKKLQKLTYMLYFGGVAVFLAGLLLSTLAITLAP